MINITSLTILSASLPRSQTDGFRFARNLPVASFFNRWVAPPDMAGSA